jgi:undecaprenyl-diphosphatase
MTFRDLVDHFDSTIIFFLNKQVVGKFRALDQSIEFIEKSFLFSGVLLLTLLWYRWFKDARARSRMQLLFGTFVAVLAGVLSRVLQHILPFHLRPLYNLHLTFPIGLEPGPLSHWNSFPSDHACIYFALATVVFLSDRLWGIGAFFCAAITCSTRIYLGIHYPSDVLAGAILGVLVVTLLTRIPLPQSIYRVLDWERDAPPSFYACAFIVSYQIATLFTDLRAIAHL